MLLAASSEVPNLQSGRSGRMSLERRRSGRQSLEAQRLLSAHSHTAPKLPLLAIQQAESEGSREASEVDGALPSHRVNSYLYFTLTFSLLISGAASSTHDWQI